VSQIASLLVDDDNNNSKQQSKAATQQQQQQKRTGRHKTLGMAGRAGSQLTKAREVGFGETVAGQMQHGVLEGTSVTIGQDEPVPINPVRIFTAVLHNLGPQHVRHGGTPHGCAGMARFSRLRLVGRNGPDRIDAQEFIGRGDCCCHDIDCCISFLWVGFDWRQPPREEFARAFFQDLSEKCWTGGVAFFQRDSG
jgi:hypothetical protein